MAAEAVEAADSAAVEDSAAAVREVAADSAAVEDSAAAVREVAADSAAVVREVAAEDSYFGEWAQKSQLT